MGTHIVECCTQRVNDIAGVGLPFSTNFAFDFEAALRRIAVPTLVVELVMPDEEHYGRQLTKVCALLGNGQGSTIMNAGKVALESHAAELTDQILRFCGTSP